MYCDWPELGRCCFCMPLRRGVLVFAYVSILFNAFMIGIYSYSVHHSLGFDPMLYGRSTTFPAEVCIAMYCLEVAFDALLIYGAHKKSVPYVKAFYYFIVTTTVAVVILQILDICLAPNMPGGIVIELLTFIFTALCIQLYLITLVRSLLKKLETSGPHLYENQLHQIVSGETKVENGIYNNTTVVPTDV